MSNGPFERAVLRKQLDLLLRTDADLSAFCLDYFPDVFQRFSPGMERMERVNLLLVLTDPAEVAARLSQRDAPSPALRGQTRRWLAGGVVLLLALLAGWGAQQRRRQATLAPQPGAIGRTLLPIPRSPEGINRGNAIERSPEARMQNHAPAASSTVPRAIINSNNRIVDSPGASMSNEVR